MNIWQGKWNYLHTNNWDLSCSMILKKVIVHHVTQALQVPIQKKPLFTDFTYDNLGVPSNLAMIEDSPELMDYYPFYYPPIAPNFNPDGLNFVDYGLGAIVTINGEMDPDEIGKMKVPSLRNTAVTPPYMHNGAFTNLTEVVDFYNTRDVGDWPEPEVDMNVNMDEFGDPGLSDKEVDAIVAFLETLTDGYEP